MTTARGGFRARKAQADSRVDDDDKAQEKSMSKEIPVTGSDRPAIVDDQEMRMATP